MNVRLTSNRACLTAGFFFTPPPSGVEIINADSCDHRETFVRQWASDFDLDVSQLNPIALMR